ncbi:putative receptor-like protein kinase [Dichanthelium oligosanthes]|uniref:Putative receptor-like protein kinase n=1 Tax=Dichanthelium oligosanthes TaxID=888268 RepID=A0A1E5UIY3_9POAL|nr:putative receptor-like protein kinase [Dichanthelium oligosanthes]
MVLPRFFFLRHAPDMLLLRVALVLSALLAAARAAYVPADSYLVLCGTAGGATVGGRAFVGDATLPASVLSAPQSAAANASAGSASANASSDEPALYRTARVFTAPSSYTFAIKKPGRHFVRLHFFPFRYQSGDLAADARFSVSVQDLVLIDGKYTPANGTATVREFSVNVAGGSLAITFTPTGKVAFVNAIEVVSHPDDLFAGTVWMVNPLGQYDGLSTQALETIHRVNMGSPKITPSSDTLWRTWLPDESFLVDSRVAVHQDVAPSTLQWMPGLGTPEAAPGMVYATATELNKALMDANGATISAQFNMTWRFQAPPASAYLIRLHFCDIVSKASNVLVFNVYVGGWSVLSNYEMTDKDTLGLLTVPLYKDFVLSSKDAAGNITVSVGPSTAGNVDPDGLLNGLEIMRMVGSMGGDGDPSSHSRSKKIIAGIVAGSVVAAVTVAMALAFVVLWVRRRKKPEKKPSSTWAAFSASALGSRSRSRSFGKSNSGGTRNNTVTLGQSAGAGYRFPFAALLEATSGFDESMVIGVGGFGKVYKGTLRDETRVAVKRGNRRSAQGLNEFRTEIELLSRLRHRHLVSLIGYCDERDEMILVYEYMAKGTLRSHLYDSELPPLSWKQRLEASIGAARGLHYLHTGSTKSIIHRDVKSANILLDDSFKAKVADFGLSKTGPELDKSHVSTAVKGSFGYLDPEYFRRQMLTDKSDVYSFGVVLLEVLCARPVIDPTLPHDMVNLAEWATKQLKNGELDSIVDQRIAATIRPESLKKFADTAEKCLAEYGVARPAMGDVLWCLEYALQLQLQEASPDGSGTDNTQLAPGLASKYQRNQSNASDGTAAAMSANLGDLDGVSMRKVFSRMIKSEEGR